MRRMSFSKEWDKLDFKDFTTYRFPRGDKDWYVGEEVSVWFKARSIEKWQMGTATIVSVEPRTFFDDERYPQITTEEAQADGFEFATDMRSWFYKTYGKRLFHESHINKITLRWTSRRLK